MQSYCVFIIFYDFGDLMELKNIGIDFPHKKGEFSQKIKKLQNIKTNNSDELKIVGA